MISRYCQIRDELSEKITTLIPEYKTNHPLGTNRKRVDNRAAMDAILFVPKTGCLWNALNTKEACLPSSAHRASKNGVMLF
ncbi:transposase [Proteus mirabilis]|nr:transposase [Proteus mirabilis]EJD6392559.1 transposase [Proteus mirabilis]MBG6001092.1 transposase [Proteus mirabilis]